MLFFYYLCLKITTRAFPYASVDIYNVDIYIIMRNYIRLILANIAVLTVTAQTATYYDTTSGVSHWVVSDILQDRQGFIWLSTWNGLNRFDGYEFRQVKASPGDGTGITSSVIRQIWSDARGDIVCRTDNGVFMLDMRNYKLRDVAAASVRSSRQTSAALTDREGNQWSIGRYGVTKTSPVHHPATIVSGTEGVQARAFMTDDTGHWWLATKEDKCIRVYDGSNTLMGYLGSDGRLHREKTPFGESAYAIMRTSHGDVWVGCKPGALLRLRKRADGAYHVERMNMKGLTNDVVYHLAEDNKGRLWAATFGGGVQCVVNPHDDKPRCVNYVKDKAFAGEAAYVRRVLITRGGQIVCATRDGLSQTVLELIPPELRRRGLFPAGRLDKDTEGFVLITDDGALAHKMLSPKSHVPKTYLVGTAYPVTEELVPAFAGGLAIDGGETCLPAQLTLSEDPFRCTLTIHEGKFHQVKRMFEAVGNRVTSLKRISIGRLALDENLPLGGCLEILHKDVEKLLSC